MSTLTNNFIVAPTDIEIKTFSLKTISLENILASPDISFVSLNKMIQIGTIHNLKNQGGTLLKD